MKNTKKNKPLTRKELFDIQFKYFAEARLSLYRKNDNWELRDFENNLIAIGHITNRTLLKNAIKRYGQYDVSIVLCYIFIIISVLITIGACFLSKPYRLILLSIHWVIIAIMEIICSIYTHNVKSYRHYVNKRTSIDAEKRYNKLARIKKTEE